MTTLRRRWFRFAFSLRTLFIVVTIFATATGWLVWQMQIVRERKATIQALKLATEGSGSLWCLKFHAYKGIPTSPLVFGHQQVSFVRRWLGDEGYVQIGLVGTFEPELIDRMDAAFPEAHLSISTTPQSTEFSSRDSLYAPSERREKNHGTLFKTGLIEK